MTTATHVHPQDLEAEMTTHGKKKLAIFTIGDKGGTSKSFLARKIAELHLEQHPGKTKLVDGDNTTGTLGRFFESAEPFVMRGKDKDRDHFFGNILSDGKEFVIVDLPAGSLTTMRTLQYDFFDAVRAKGYDVTLVAPITPYAESIFDFQELVELADPQAFAMYESIHKKDAGKATGEVKSTAESFGIPLGCKYISVVNLGLAEDEDDFELWNEAHYTRGLLKFVGGKEITFPKLRPLIASTLAKHKLKFRDGAKSEFLHHNPSLVSMLSRFNANADAALAKAKDELGL